MEQALEPNVFVDINSTGCPVPIKYGRRAHTDTHTWGEETVIFKGVLKADIQQVHLFLAWRCSKWFLKGGKATIIPGSKMLAGMDRSIMPLTSHQGERSGSSKTPGMHKGSWMGGVCY